MKGIRVILIYFLELVFIIGSLGNLNLALADDFSDVPTTHWAYNAITALKDAGILGGYADNTFLPTKAVSRIEAVVLLMRLEQTTGLAPEQTVDIPDQLEAKLGWSAVYYKLGLASGVLAKDDFGKDMSWPVQRQEIAVWISRMLPKQTSIDSEKRNFIDISSLNGNTKNAIEIVAAAGIMTGNSKAQFVPDGYVSRAELAAITYRLKNVLATGPIIQPLPTDTKLGGRVISLMADKTGKYIVLDSAPGKTETLSANCKIRSSDGSKGVASIKEGDQVILYRNTSGRISLIEKINVNNAGVIRSNMAFLKVMPDGVIALRNGQTEKLNIATSAAIFLNKKKLDLKNVPFGAYITAFKYNNHGNINSMHLSSRSSGDLMELSGQVKGRRLAPAQFAIILGYNTVITISEMDGTMYENASDNSIAKTDIIDGMQVTVSGIPDSNGYQIMWAHSIQAQ